MALNAFQFTGGGNVAVGVVPLGVQVVGPTIVVTNIGTTTVYGSLGGSASTTLNPPTFVTGLPAPAGAAGSTATGVAGAAIPPGQQVTLAVGANTFLWLATLTGVGSVNVANGT